MLSCECRNGRHWQTRLPDGPLRLHLGIHPFPGFLFALLGAASCQLCTHQAAGAAAEYLGDLLVFKPLCGD